ncbi:MAG: hypothetical protein ACI96M_003909 [Candidatus Azotimanducaceae bacterium]
MVGALVASGTIMAQSIQTLFPKMEVFSFLVPEDYEAIESYVFRYQY